MYRITWTHADGSTRRTSSTVAHLSRDLADVRQCGRVVAVHWISQDGTPIETEIA